MGAISALSTAVDTLRRNPILFGAAFVVVLVNFALSGVTMTLPPTTASLVSLPLSGLTLLVTPFFVGGVLSMANEGLDGRTRLETFVSGGKSNYVRLLGAMVLFAVLLGIIAFAAVLGLIVVAVFALGVSTTAGTESVAASGGSFLVLALFGLVSTLVIMVPVFLLQFYPAAIVVSDLGVVDSLKRSAGLVRRNLLSTLGYTAIAVLVGSVVGFVAAVTSVVASLSFQAEQFASTEVAIPEVGLGVLAVAVLVAVALTTVVSAFASVYQIAFYDDVLGRTATGDDHPPTVDAP